jgi:hypothetical protein
VVQLGAVMSSPQTGQRPPRMGCGDRLADRSQGVWGKWNVSTDSRFELMHQKLYSSNERHFGFGYFDWLTVDWGPCYMETGCLAATPSTCTNFQVKKELGSLFIMATIHHFLNNRCCLAGDLNHLEMGQNSNRTVIIHVQMVCERTTAACTCLY